MSSMSYHIPNLLDKMTSTDKDLRFMATNDLMVELQKDSIKLDDESERKVVRMILKLLEDKNGEVQNLAVKCLGPLVVKVKELQVETIVDTLCNNMVSDKEQLRDISSIALKTVINELPPGASLQATSVCRRIIVQLCRAISMTTDVSVQLEALDILADLLSRFGSLLVNYHANILEALLPQLCSPRLAVRKRTIIALGHLVLSCSIDLYGKLIDHLLECIQRKQDNSATRTYINAVAAISRGAGHRFGEHLERVLPLVVAHCQADDDELREHCLQALEAFVDKCPKEVTPHIGTILGLCLRFLSHDPNYNYAVDEEEMDDTDGDDEDNEDDYSDDDDMSWKVRRAAAKCLEVVIATRREMLLEFYRTVSPELINRFKEREENVKADIFHAYISLLRQTKASTSVVDTDFMDDGESPLTTLQQQVPSLVKGIHRQLKERSTKTRQGCFSLLRELILVLKGALTDHIGMLMPGIQYSLGERNASSNMKIDTLVFVHCLLANHPAEVFHPHVDRLLPCLVAAVNDPFYKITAEALHVLQELVRVIRPLDTASKFDFTPYMGEIYTVTLTKLRAADIDQEVKERAIGCMGQLVSQMGDHLQAQLPVCLPILLDRLRNEITRLTTVKALTMIAASPLKVDVRVILGEALPILGSFLRKNQRALKLATLTLLDRLVVNYPGFLTAELLQPALTELPALLTEADLHIAQLSLAVLSSVCHLAQPAAALVQSGFMVKVLLPPVFKLTKSPLLQGAALRTMSKFFTVLVTREILPADRLLAMLLEPVSGDAAGQHINKQAYSSIAQCVAAVCLTDARVTEEMVRRLLRDIKSSSVPDARRTFALLAVAEIGRHVDLSGVEGLRQTILASFGSQSEEVKQATSYALGSVACGNLAQFLPFVLNEIETQHKRQYLLLHSLKEIISCSSERDSLQHYQEGIWDNLFRHCQSPEEGTRNVVAECLGKLTLLHPETLLPRLQSALHATDSPLMRTTIVTAIKFTITEQPQPVDALLRHCIGDFLATIGDPQLEVRRVALVALNSAAHNKPVLVRDLLDTLLPQLYNETKVRKELIREVEMGPFKHTVDDGLDLRKAGYECMYTLLDSCLDRLDIYTFLNHVEEGLKDDYDIKMLTYLMLVRLATLVPNAVLQRLDRLVDPLRTTCSAKVKQNSVKQEFEKQDELKRSALRVVVALLAIPDADKNLQLSEFVSHIKSSPDLQALFDSIQHDSTSDSAAMMDLS
ncbi:Cullin-associated NEDD8-dissociated protein 1 [Amphibalanus amphitrite]|uniref:Cullin-associated NEDD8-dissociated protein 1 n=1 Tax=Amphibalanus amphitrite TaxID=1232801 RepID=A0A6A4UYH5_AMPAM|nr:cullin-associated NEDD8-dissociated protein 1-like [Amphibalanus amphitrite]XP_043205156.1 cullin-associated NEDD8-dissociated protein 1-like [Amphibalanus amphitrite]XP_043205165.1 cullin-associated NEDD8-dissociated protein 1-like [Amphibalanus amphitrite]XP_043205175.1 cullin-associated NEDD8-dissociated protein 1-like [Amphibalanus amphitrite]XP_043205183.1 cullin-associated NEDD8-dissociated protein 1-like [Amphibalanus amphitrite]XP_043205193.1 cullin-associated NEDD8-dissociated prot